MNFKAAASFLLSVALAASNINSVWADPAGPNIDVAPATVYEAAELSPQNMDYDKANKMFIAHGGWYNNRLVHYYKFRIFAPGTYPGLISGPPNMSNAGDVPLQKVYMMTTTGDFGGIVGKPVVEYHTADGNSYSDFMIVTFVMVDAAYVADTYKSVRDINDSGATFTKSDIVVNLPVVPTGSKLQSPEDKSKMAPISPVMAFYKGVEVQTFVFEVNNMAAFDYFNPKTRTDPANADYKIPVVTTFASKEAVSSIPLWHVNQFTRGVSAEKDNQGGPSDAGMRNIINLDRPDPGYSPLWQLFWVTELPIDYTADQVSHSSDLTSANGIVSVATPMFVNCPDIGPVGAADNAAMVDSHTLKLDLAKTSNHLLGSHMSVIMQGDQPLKVVTEDGTVIEEAKTNMMGGYEIELMSSKVPEGTTKLMIKSGDIEIRKVEVENTASGGAIVGLMSAAALTMAVMVGIVM